MVFDLIRVSKSSIDAFDIDAVVSVLRNEYLGMGPTVGKFEQTLEGYFGRHVACVSSGTAALQLALQSLEFEPDYQVLVPTVTYVASFQAVTAAGGRPIPVDICLQTAQIDLEDAQRKMNREVKAIMPVQYAGDASKLTAIYQFAKKNALRVVEDDAHAFGTRCNSGLVGSFGDISCFSFDGIKNLTAGEGGAVVSDDIRIINAIKDARLLGVKDDSEKRVKGERAWDLEVSKQGWRYHMQEMNAALGLSQFRKFPSIIAKRRALAKSYDRLLERVVGVTTFKRDYDSVVPHIYPILVDPSNRDSCIQYMREHDVQCGIHYKPCHLLERFKIREELPCAERLYTQLVTLPLHLDLTESDQNKIVLLLDRFLST